MINNGIIAVDSISLEYRHKIQRINVPTGNWLLTVYAIVVLLFTR